MEIKLSKEKLRLLALFEKLTGVTPRDCVNSGNGERLTFVVSEGDMGRAIGVNGRNIEKVRDKLEETVLLVEYSDDPKEFLRNIFSSVEVEKIELDEIGGKKKAKVKVKESDKGRAVGKNGWNIERARKLSKRLHGTSDVCLA